MTMADDTGTAAPARAAQPAGRSCWTDLGGPVHYLDFGGPADGPVLVCVHGLGGSAVNWISVAPQLAGSCRVLAPDLAGHGLTQSAGRGSGVAANTELLHRFIGEVAGGPVILAGNSMGGMISLLEASAAADAVSGLILLDPALPFVLAWPDPLVTRLFAAYLVPWLNKRLTDRQRLLSPAEVVAGVLELCCADPSRITQEVIARHVEVASQRAAFPGIDRDFELAARSVVATIGYPMRRAYQRQIRSVGCPVLLIHGTRDRLVPVAAARAAARTAARGGRPWTVREFPDVGHVPQLEAPQETVAAITEWLGSGGRAAAAAASH